MGAILSRPQRVKYQLYNTHPNGYGFRILEDAFLNIF